MNKQKWELVLVWILYIVGVLILIYPIGSDWWNKQTQTTAIGTYQKSVNENKKRNIQLYEQAQLYNAQLYERGDELYNGKGNFDHYEQQLLLPNSDVMGYIEIPMINVSLPIYHGTDQAVLQRGIGHMEGTSLPVGGRNTHSVLTGHTGLPSGGKLLTDLNQVKEGNLFWIQVLDHTLYYQVDQIKVVTPNNVASLSIEKGKDYVTLLTCTPYGINSHRLLVRGRRVPAPKSIKSNAKIISPWIGSAVIMLIFSCVECIVYVIWKTYRRRGGNK